MPAVGCTRLASFLSSAARAVTSWLGIVAAGCCCVVVCFFGEFVADALARRLTDAPWVSASACRAVLLRARGLGDVGE